MFFMFEQLIATLFCFTITGCVLVFSQGKLMKQHSWAYFRNKWNLLELAIILLSWSALSVFIKRTLLGNRDMSYYQTHKNQWVIHKPVFFPLMKERWWFCSNLLMWLPWHVHAVVSSVMYTVMCASNLSACYATNVSAHKGTHCTHNAARRDHFSAILLKVSFLVIKGGFLTLRML